MRFHPPLNRFLVRHPAQVSLASLLLVLVTAWVCRPVVHTDVDARPETLLAGDERNRAAYDKMSGMVHGQGFLMVDLESDDLYSEAGMERLRAFSQGLQDMPEVGDVKSLTHSVKPVRRGMGFEMVPFVTSGARSPEEWRQLESFCRKHPLVRGIMASADGRHTLVTAVMSDALETRESWGNLLEEIHKLTHSLDGPGVRWRILALPFAELEVRQTLLDDVKNVLPWILVVVMGLVAAWMRCLWAPLWMVLSQGLYLLIAWSLGAWMGFQINLYQLMLPALVAALHLMLQVHQWGSIRSWWSRAGSRRRQLASLDLGVRHVFRACTLASWTTVVGLLSLLASEVHEVRQFGLWGAGAVVLGWVWAFGPGFSWLVWFSRVATPRKESSGRGGAVWHGWNLLTVWLVRFRRPLLMAVCCWTVLALVGLRAIQTDIRVVEFLPEDSPTREGLELLDATYGGINIVQIDLRAASAGGVHQGEFLKALERVQQKTEARDGVSATYSYAQLLAMMNHIWEGEAEGSLQVPDSFLKRSLFVTALKSRDYPFLRALVNEDFSQAHLVLRTQDMPSGRYLALVRDIEKDARKMMPDSVEVSARDGLRGILEADQRVMRGQTWSLGSTACVFVILLALLWRMPALALLSVMLNLLPVLSALAFSAWFQVPLNSVTIMMAALVLGMGIDDTVHLVLGWRDAREHGLPPEHALTRALQEKGGPIVLTSLVLLVLFLGFLGFSLPPVRQFGALAAVAFAISLMVVLVILPACLLGLPREGKSQAD